jgi:hypothetical protein
MGTNYKTIKAQASKESTATLFLGISAANQRRTKALGRNDLAETQALNLVISAMTEALTDRLPELDAAIDAWCDELGDGRTMAQFMIDWATANKDCLA